MRARITVGILNYRRPPNVDLIVSALRSQSIPCDIFLWDNSGEGQSFADVDWVVRSSVNAYCWPRWFLLSNAATETVMTLDDDLSLASPAALEAIVASLDKLTHHYEILGPEGVVLDGDSGYFPRYGGRVVRDEVPAGLRSSLHVIAGAADRRVDIVKGRSMAMRSELIRAVLPMFVGRDEVCDDIAVSALAAEGRIRAHRVPSAFAGLFVDLPLKNAPMALSMRADWREVREAACCRYFGARRGSKSHG